MQPLGVRVLPCRSCFSFMLLRRAFDDCSKSACTCLILILALLFRAQRKQGYKVATVEQQHVRDSGRLAEQPKGLTSKQNNTEQPHLVLPASRSPRHANELCYFSRCFLTRTKYRRCYGTAVVEPTEEGWEGVASNSYPTCWRYLSCPPTRPGSELASPASGARPQPASRKSDGRKWMEGGTVNAVYWLTGGWENKTVFSSQGVLVRMGRRPRVESV